MLFFNCDFLQDAQIEVLEVLHSEDDHHETVMSSNYEDFLNKIVLFLEEIFDSLPEPFLVKVCILLKQPIPTIIVSKSPKLSPSHVCTSLMCGHFLLI